ncbi:UNVERIFIED_CONTAM: hypothetical protein HDU68_005693, partial [Siphonaria sp. JEL0065]
MIQTIQYSSISSASNITLSNNTKVSTEATQITRQEVISAYTTFSTVSSTLFAEAGEAPPTTKTPTETATTLQRQSTSSINTIQEVWVLVEESIVCGIVSGSLDLDSSPKIGRINITADPRDKAAYLRICNCAVDAGLDWIRLNKCNVEPNDIEDVEARLYIKNKNTVLASLLQEKGFSIRIKSVEFGKPLVMDTESHTPTTTTANIIHQFSTLGYEIRPFNITQHGQLVYESDQKAFIGTPFSGSTFEHWIQELADPSEGYDPSLWYILWNIEKDAVAGGILVLDPPRFDKIAYVAHVWVDGSVRGKGIGKLLMEYTFSRLAESKVGEEYRFKSVMLHADEGSNSATGLYEK